MNKGIVFNPAGDVSVDVAFSAALAGDVAIGVTSSMDLAGNVTVGVASSANLAGDVTVGVASLADLAGVVTVGVATSVFERMCVADPRFGRRLWPCRRRFVSADSSPLMVRGELCMTVVFPGLQCDMMLVIASIGSEGLLGMEAFMFASPA